MSSPAATLGRHSGVALIGQPLDIRLQVMLAPGEDIGTQCIGADVFYGDIPVPPNQVAVTASAAAGETMGTARIFASLPINEPIVTVAVRAGCGLAFTRRYVLLADLVSEPAVTSAPQSPAPVVVAAPPAGAPLPAPAPASTSVQTAPSSAPAAAPVVRARPPAPPRPPKVAVTPRARPAPAPKAPAPATAAAPAPTTAAAASRAPAAGASRLRLDPPELAADGGAPGVAAEGAAAAPTEPNPLEAALASANAEVQRNAERLAAIETEMARFREAQQRDQARVAELSAQLARAEAQRYNNWLIYVLGGLLLLALGAIALLARRQRRDAAIASDASRAWWADRQDDDEVDEAPRMSRRAPLEPSAPVPLESLDVDLDVDSSPVPLQAAPAAARKAPAADRREFMPSAMGVSRSVATEELFDVQQQADFFVSLGEDDQAIAVLRNHLAESHEPSPLAYLDLFRLYHRLGRRDEYDSLREEFNRVFNAGAPPFERYSDKGRGLEAYETAFGRIQALWPQSRVLDLIERSIFRDNEEGETEVFDLEAYRELLMLHAIAKDLVERESATQPPMDFQHTNMQPLKAAGKAAPAAPANEDAMRRTVPMDLHVIPPASQRLSLDVNIEDLEAESQFEASLPEVDVPVEPTAGRGRAMRDGDSMIDFEIVDNDPPAGQRRGGDRTEGDDEEARR